MQRADEQARRLGVDRREFLASSMGLFTTLAVINQVSGCSGKNGDGTTKMSPDDVKAMMSGGTGGSPVLTGSGGSGSNTGASGMHAGGTGGSNSSPMGGGSGGKGGGSKTDG